MDAQQFLAEFEHIANSPEGVDQLRELVLHLAVTGDLISTDAPVDASPLLDLIEKQKREHPDRKKVITKQASISRAAIKAPPHWAVCRIGDLALTITGGGTPSKSHPTYWGGSIPWASVKDLRELKFIDDTEDRITEEGLKNSSSNLIPPGRVIVCTRMGLGKVAINRVALAINQDLKALELPNEVNTDFFLILYKTREVKGTGTTVSGIKQDQLLALPAALPPLEEQSRIAAKVDELMALCDKLEAQQQARRKLQNALRQSTLQAVASATSPRELQTSWARLADNFGRLFHAPEDIADFRKMASELAIRGVLDVYSEPTDTSTVDVYLAELGRKKSGKRFAKSVQPAEEISLPNGWRWVLLEDLLSDSESGWSPKCEAEPRREGEWGVLKVSAVTWGAFNPNENKRLPLSLESRPECEVKPSDFMLSRANTAELVARSVIAPDNCPEKLLMSDKIVRLNFLDDALKPWVNLVNNSDLARAYYKERATGTSDSMRNVSRKVIHELPIPLPSLKVQERVLLALSRLLRYCDSLEQQAASRMRLSTQLAASSIASLTGIAIEQEEESMKAPPTELIAPLRLGTTPDIKAHAPLATILARHNGEMSTKDLWKRFGGEIDAFYAQLKAEVSHGWILEPVVLRLRSDLDIDTISSELKSKAQLVSLIKDFGGVVYEKDLCERFDRGLDAFNAQLKFEIGYNWIVKSSVAEIKVVSEESGMA